MNTAENILKSASLMQLISGLVELPESGWSAVDVQVNGVKLDSRQLQAGDLFIAFRGQQHDGRDFIEQALSQGVAGVLAESGGQWSGATLSNGVPVIAVDNLAAKVSEIAGRFYNNPSSRLKIIGITGTNGKTSCGQFIAQLLGESGYSCGVIGTLGCGPYGDLAETQNTTPDAIFNQAALAKMEQGGLDAVTMEVSSIGLHQHRVKAIHFDTAVFTNLTRDHLDYHGSMESYLENKLKLFNQDGLRAAVVNLDDDNSLNVLDGIPRRVELFTYSLTKASATVFARNLILDRQGFRAQICTPYGFGEIQCKLFGLFNVSNVLASIATLVGFFSCYKKASIEQLFDLVSRVKPVAGRMEVIGNTEEITAIVDYAHTPDGLKSALMAARDHFHGNIWCVFGCGGNRDKGKRPLMGEIAEQFANKLIIADDNPRKENGEEIIQHILSGIGDPSKVVVIRDRALAIQHAINNASAGDIVLVAGKGHENYQDIGGSKTIFSDANQIRLALHNREKSNRIKGK